MTFYEVVVGGGLVSSLALAAVLVSLWPARRRRCVLSLAPDDRAERRPDVAPLVTPVAPRWRNAGT